MGRGRLSWRAIDAVLVYNKSDGNLIHVGDNPTCNAKSEKLLRQKTGLKHAFVYGASASSGVVCVDDTTKTPPQCDNDFKYQTNVFCHNQNQ